MSARRVTRAGYFPPARGRAGDRGRVRALLVEPVDSPRSAPDTAINHASAAASGCVRVRACPKSRGGMTLPLPQHALPGYVLVGSVAACAFV